MLGRALYGNNFIVSKVKSEVFEQNFEKSIKSSLERLCSEALYGLLLHDMQIFYDNYASLDEKVRAAKNQGLFSYFGVSIYSEEDFDLAINSELVDMIQLPFNIFDQRAITEKWFERAKSKNKLIFIRSIFLQGLLLIDVANVPSKLNRAVKYIQQLDSICEKYNITKLELSLAFVDAVARDSILLFGCDSLQQAHDNLSLYNNLKHLTKKQISEIVEMFGGISKDIYLPTNW